MQKTILLLLLLFWKIKSIIKRVKNTEKKKTFLKFQVFLNKYLCCFTQSFQRSQHIFQISPIEYCLYQQFFHNQTIWYSIIKKIVFENFEIF